VGIALLVTAGLALAYGWQVRRQYAAPVAIVLHDEIPLRSAPYGSAPAARSLYAGSAVTLLRIDGAWMLVKRGDGEGWVLRGEVARL
jgi:hypothetical protein